MVRRASSAGATAATGPIAGVPGSFHVREPVRVVGSVMVDDITTEPGRARSLSYGGVGHNVVRQLARCGIRATFITVSSDEAPLAEARAAGVRVLTKRVEQGVGYFEGKLDASGDVVRTSITLPALEALDDAFLDDCMSLENGTIVMETGLPARVRRRCLAHALRSGDTAWALPTRLDVETGAREMLSQFDAVVLNEREAATLLSRDLPDMSAVLAAARDLLAARTSLVAITLGADGVVVKTPCFTGHLPARAVSVTSTLGAGDAFAAGLCATLARRGTLEAAARHGLELASRVVASPYSVPAEGASP